MQSIWVQKRAFPFAKIDLIGVAVFQMYLSHEPSELLHFKVNFKPEIWGDPLGGETVGEAV